MDSRILLLIMIITTALVSGCTDIGLDIGKVSSSGLGDTIEGSEEGTGYLDEGDSEILFELELEKDQYLTHMMCVLNWRDEDPEGVARRYINEPDTFTLRITDGEYVSVLGTAENIYQGDGVICVVFPSNVADNQTTTRPMVISIILTLINSGDQYPMNHVTESTKIEDTGNAYVWRLEYEYLDRS
jgi:hypothetical protein